MIYGLGFTLEKVAAMQEHGIKGDSSSRLLRDILTIYLVYFDGTWVSLGTGHKAYAADGSSCRMDLI